EHWQTRWEKKLSTASRVQQADWHAPDRTEWTGRVADAVNASGKPVVLVAHSLGVAAAVQAIPQFRTRVAGALLVAAPDLDADGDLMEERRQFGPWPRDPLPFPAMMIA